jgi:hypothetical protein
LCTGVPIIVFFLAVTFMTDVEGNWPIPGYLTLIVLVAVYLPGELDCYRQRVRDWEAKSAPRPKEGLLRRKPETAWQVAWHWTLGWGIGALIVIMFGGWALHLPGAEHLPGVGRISGHRQRAAEVHAAAVPMADRAGERPFIVADHYQHASLLAFYLPGQPKVYCAASRMGKRINPYDHFGDVDLAGPGLRGRSAVLVDSGIGQWHKTLAFDRIEKLEHARGLFAGYGYAGPKARASGAGH